MCMAGTEVCLYLIVQCMSFEVIKPVCSCVGGVLSFCMPHEGREQVERGEGLRGIHARVPPRFDPRLRFLDRTPARKGWRRSIPTYANKC